MTIRTDPPRLPSGYATEKAGSGFVFIRPDGSKSTTPMSAIGVVVEAATDARRNLASPPPNPSALAP